MHTYVCAWVLLISLDVPSPSDGEVPVNQTAIEMNDQINVYYIASDSLIPSFERKPGNEVNRIVQTDRKNHKL